MVSEVEIANLIYRYAEYIDAGDFAGAAELFKHSKIKLAGRDLNHKEILEVWEKFIIRYEDGTPRTKHVITNPIIEVDERNNKATMRSYYNVIQRFPDGKIHTVVAGRYHDWFERHDGVWRWSYRDYTLLDLEGDLSHHASGRV